MKLKRKLRVIFKLNFNFRVRLKVDRKLRVRLKQCIDFGVRLNSNPNDFRVRLTYSESKFTQKLGI